jgi:hypothetical protein
MDKMKAHGRHTCEKKNASSEESQMFFINSLVKRKTRMVSSFSLGSTVLFLEIETFFDPAVVVPNLRGKNLQPASVKRPTRNTSISVSNKKTPTNKAQPARFETDPISALEFL